MSEASLLAKVAVFKSEKIEHAVKPNGVDALLCVCHYTGFCVEGYSEAGLAKHGQVVGAIAHGYGLCEVHFFHLCDELQKLCLTVSVNDLADITSCQLSVFANLQFVGIDIVDAIFALKEFAEICKSAA